MERITSLALLVSLLIMFASVVNQTRATTCVDGLGTCENCDQKCKAKHGPSSESSCDRSVGVPLCRCYYECLSTTTTSTILAATKPKVCNGGAGLCSQACSDNCCDQNCAQKFSGGHGICNSIGNYRLCQCQYSC